MALGPIHARDGLGFSSHKQDKSKESYTVDPNGETLKSVKNIKDRRYYSGTIYHGAIIFTNWSIKPTKSLGSLSACLGLIV